MHTDEKGCVVIRYSEAKSHVNSLLRFGVKPGLDTITALMARLGNPQDRLCFVHVAGTSGKGSVSRMVSGMCRAAGLRTGLFISPYVLDFRERIQIDGAWISKIDFATAAEQARAAAEQSPALSVTEFEMITAIAFVAFLAAGCELVVLETGLGGRFDATNCIKTPRCAVITVIGLDHTDILGDTVAAIAAEKCGIIKPGGVTVCYPEQSAEALAVIRDAAARQKNRLIGPDLAGLELTETDIGGSRFCYRGTDYTLPLCGRHQVINAVTAIEAARVLMLPEAAIRDGLAAAVFPARIELLRAENPAVILDGAHNADKIAALCRTLTAAFGEQKFIFIFGMLGDKDVEGALGRILPLARQVITVPIGSPRAISPAALARRIKAYTPTFGAPPADVMAVRSHTAALTLAGQAARETGCPVVITGSLYLAAAIRQKTMGFFGN